MNDPHVEALLYAFVPDEGVKFTDPPAITFTTPDFFGRLADNVLTLEPKAHYAGTEDVCPIADRFLKAWIIREGAATGRSIFHFQFLDAKIVDRAPQPGAIYLSARATASVRDSADTELQRPRYPDLPGNFGLTPEIEVMWRRFVNFLGGKESLLAMAYYCLDFLKTRAGSRQAAQEQFGISGIIFDTLGRLTSRHGDPTIARKGDANKPLTESEAEWVKVAIRSIILHLGDPGRLKRLTMADLPKL